MADWTAHSDHGELAATREPAFHPAREAAPPRLRAEPRAPRRAGEPAALSPGVAALAQYNAGHGGPLARAGLAVWAGGGILSLALMAGLGVWGYKLVLREVMGLPVVAAEAGPMRVLPADPQGEVVPSQGLAVNAIPAAGTAAPPSDVLVLAPQAPGLAEEDLMVVQTMAEAGEVMPASVVSALAADPLALVEAGTEPPAPASEPILAATAGPAAPEPALAATAGPATPAPVPVASGAAATPAPVLVASAAAVVPPPVLVASAGSSATPPAAGPAASPEAEAARLVAALLPADRAMTAAEILAFADQVAAGAQALPPATPVAQPVAPATPAPAAAAGVAAGGAAAPATSAIAPAPTVVPVASPALAAAPARPLSRPSALGRPASAVPAAPIPAPVEAAPAPASGGAVAPSLPAGTSLVQLGAFDSAEIAAAEWERLQGRFGEFLGSKERIIQEAQSEGRTFFRLRALGFADRADARRLCAALTAEDAACIPVTVD